MITRRTLEGAEKCAFRAFLRLECRLELIFVMSAVVEVVLLWLQTIDTCD